MDRDHAQRLLNGGDERIDEWSRRLVDGERIKSMTRSSGTSVCPTSPALVQSFTLVLSPLDSRCSFAQRGRSRQLSCAVESVIANRFALIGAMKPMQFHSCLISYSTNDEEFAKHLHSHMIKPDGIVAGLPSIRAVRSVKLHLAQLSDEAEVSGRADPTTRLSGRCFSVVRAPFVLHMLS
jgi:hypothetical protein